MSIWASAAIPSLVVEIWAWALGDFRRRVAWLVTVAVVVITGDGVCGKEMFTCKKSLKFLFVIVDSNCDIMGNS